MRYVLNRYIPFIIIEMNKTIYVLMFSINEMHYSQNEFTKS